MKKVRKFARKYRYEIVLLGIGALAGYSIANNRNLKHEGYLVDSMNDVLEKAFDEVKGNFSTGDGKYLVPILYKE